MDRLIRLAAKVPPANSVFKLPARRRSQSFFFNVIWLTLVIASAIPFSSFAQNTTADQQEQRERTERQAREREQRQSVPQIGQPDDKNRVSRYSNTDLPSEQACFRIDALALQGDRADEFAFAQRYLNRYAGRCLGQESISLIVRRVSDLVLARGYVTTRIGLPEQNLSEGTLTLLLVPGTIREIRFTGNESDSLWCSAFPARPGGLLNLRSLEQGLEQIKRVPSQDASMEIIPGELPGQSDVVITLQQQKPWRTALTLDDAGSRATGKSQIGTTFYLDNVANRNDLLTLGMNHDGSGGKGRGTEGYNLSWSIPWGNWRFGLSGYGYLYGQTILGATQSFGTSGRSSSAEMAAERLIARGQRYRTSAELRVGQRHARSFIENVEIDNQRRRTSFAELALLHRQYWGSAQIDLRLAHRRGLPWLGGDDDAAGLAENMPTFRYGISSFDAGVSMPLHVGQRPLLWNSALRYQWSGDTLYGSEFVAIGGRFTVNGFDGENSLGGMNGGYWRNSVSLPLHRAFAPYAGIDIGHISSDQAQGIDGGTLSGAYLGTRGDAGDALSWDAFVGWPINHPMDFIAEGRVVGFRLAYQF